MGSEKKVENLSLLFRVKKKCLKNALFSPQREKERSFWKSFFFWTKKTILLFREFFRKESFVSLFSLRAIFSRFTPRKKKTWNASDDSTQKARRHHPRRDPREKTNAQTKKRPHGNASGCLKKEKSTEPWRSPRRARSARERRRRCRERNKIVQCRKGIIDIV